MSDKFEHGQLVRKKGGSEWQGVICGWYSTQLTPEGYAVQSESHKGSVQIYPASALELVPTKEVESLEVLKEKAETLRLDAERAWYDYACQCELGAERDRAFEIYENIRTARRR